MYVFKIKKSISVGITYFYIFINRSHPDLYNICKNIRKDFLLYLKLYLTEIYD